MTVAEYNLSVDQHADSIFRFIVKNLKDEDRARDVVQDTYTKLWIKYAEVSFEKCKSYLFTTAYHTMIDMLRKEKKIAELEKIDFVPESKDPQYSDLKEVLNEATGTLPEIQRSVLMLRDYEGYSYKEIEEITGLNENQVKVYIYRARKYLMKYIGSIETLI
jgi:RNA polymerase sigma-70 factor (ECF subfamily)